MLLKQITHSKKGISGVAYKSPSFPHLLTPHIFLHFHTALAAIAVSVACTVITDDPIVILAAMVDHCCPIISDIFYH